MTFSENIYVLVMQKDPASSVNLFEKELER